MKKPPIFVMIFVLIVSGVSLVYAGQYQWRGLYEDAQHNFRTGLQAQSLALAKESLRKADVEYGTDSLYALKSLTLVGDLYAASGAYSESARYYRKALEVQKKIFVSPHPNAAKLLNSLAVVEFKEGQVSDAKAKFAKSIEIADLSGHGSDPCMAESLLGMSEALKAAGDYEESEKTLLAALNILDNYSKYNPKLNLTIANARVSLAECLKAQGKYREANAQYRAAIKYFETRGIASQKTMIDSLIAMGDCYVSSNKKARALDCYKRALAAANGNRGDDMTAALVSRRLAGVYKTVGNIPEARRYYRLAVTSLENCSPSGCPLLADTQKSLGDLGEKSRKSVSDTPA